MAPQVKLVYFPLRARGELIRVILAAGGIAYEEELVTFEQWPAKKPTTPLGTLPLLYWGKEELGQSLNVARFVAKKAGLAGGDDIGMARADMIAETVADVIIKYYDIRFCKGGEEEKEKLMADFCGSTVPGFFKSAEAILAKRGGKSFSGGSGMCYADIAVMLFVDLLTNAKEVEGAGFSAERVAALGGCAAEKAPAVAALAKSVRASPKIAAYLDARPDYPF